MGNGQNDSDDSSSDEETENEEGEEDDDEEKGIKQNKYRDDFCQLFYLTDFSYFPLICILKITGYSQNRSKMELFKGDVDGFSYFSFTFSYFQLTWPQAM